ncbi:MAG: DUF3467 domain-containing protein [Planctomycetota bacterium]|nr:DUF3467 domain-containing protein [Planctomycetota bacterium]
MADQPAQQSRNVQIRVDESHMHTAYANTIRTSTTPDEVVLDFGLNLPMQQGQQQGADAPMQMVFSVGSRVVLNWAGAKRLAQTLGNAVKAYEDARGEIQMNR